jgi:hypothetical protein
VSAQSYNEGSGQADAGWRPKGATVAEITAYTREFQAWTKSGPDNAGITALAVDGALGPKTLRVVIEVVGRARKGAGGSYDQNWGAAWDQAIKLPGEHSDPAPQSAAPAPAGGGGGGGGGGGYVDASPAPKQSGSIMPIVIGVVLLGFLAGGKKKGRR